MKLTDRIADAGFWLGWNVLWLLPASLSYRLFDLGAKLAWRRRIAGVKQLELNLSRVLGCEISDPRLRQLSREGMRSYMRYYCETFLLPRWSDEELINSVVPINAQPVLEALKTGGAVMTLPHSGNWDHAGAWAAKYFGSLCTVAERLRPEGVFQKFLAMRVGRGMQIMPLTGEGGTYEYLRNHVNDGRLVALLGDRDVAKNGMGNQFFGHRASLPIGAALLALDTGRPLFTCAASYEGDKLVITFDDELEFDRTPVNGRDRLRRAQEITLQVAQRFERHISAHPANWHQLQPVWTDLIAGDEK
jgi:KDO2-lipid IV(A) lauroyltransferase